ncbi:MAG: hypothetical protein ACXIU8_08780 [Alkalilacustris sp.]
MMRHVRAVAAAATLSLGLPTAADAALLKVEFEITALQRTGASTEVTGFLPISGSFVFDTATPISITGLRAVEDLQFTLVTPLDDIDVKDFVVSGSDLFGVGPQVTIRNSQSDPGNFLSLRFSRTTNGLNLALLQTSQGVFNTVGVPASRNTVRVSEVVPGAAVIPLPAAGWLLGFGIAGLMALRLHKAP